VRSVPYGESDLVATFFTETDGKLAAIVRGARRSSKRFGGALEPIHELFIVLEDKGKELGVLKEARIARARSGVVADLARMETAGRALRWTRHLCPTKTPEPAAWLSLRAFLEALDRRDGASPLPLLAVVGLRLLADVGYGIDLERCVRCGRPCPSGRPAFVDSAGGGLVCTGCGGARRTLGAEARELGARALSGRDDVTLSDAQANELVAVVEEAMAAHADFDPHATKARAP
jgi:DNA repair protein RecO (recombination protein O)